MCRSPFFPLSSSRLQLLRETIELIKSVGGDFYTGCLGKAQIEKTVEVKFE